jgi:hypothetical protein
VAPDRVPQALESALVTVFPATTRRSLFRAWHARRELLSGEGPAVSSAENLNLSNVNQTIRDHRRVLLK